MENSSGPNETLELVGKVLIRCFVMGAVLLLLWAGMLLFAGDFVYAVHSIIFEISREQFNIVHYAGMTIFKLAIFVLFLFPYIAIRLVNRKR